MPYMLLMVEPTGQRRTPTEAEGREVCGRMLKFADDRRARGQLLQGKTSLGPYGRMALLVDTEGNRIGLHSMQ